MKKFFLKWAVLNDWLFEIHIWRISSSKLYFSILNQISTNYLRKDSNSSKIQVSKISSSFFEISKNNFSGKNFLKKFWKKKYWKNYKFFFSSILEWDSKIVSETLKQVLWKPLTQTPDQSIIFNICVLWRSSGLVLFLIFFEWNFRVFWAL